MNQWAFVIAAYAVTVVATAGLLIESFVWMRRAEAEADRLRSNDR
jgi:heme exporter protein D